MPSAIPSLPLAGCTVVVTRPVGNTRPFMRRVIALGGRAVALPGLALRRCADVQSARSALTAAMRADACIFTSPAAVHFALALMPDFALGEGQAAYCVGAGTQRALARHGIRAHAPTTSSDSEGMLILPQLAKVQGQHFALIGAPGGRGLIAATLRERGAEVTRVHVYARVAPRLDRRHFDALAKADDPLILPLSSAEALDHLVARLPQPLLARLRSQTVVASSSRLADLAHERGFHSVKVAASAMTEDLLAAAIRIAAHHRL